MKNISIKEFKKIYLDNNDLIIIDVRTPVEYNTQHLAGSHNLPLDVIDNDLVDTFLKEKGASVQVVYLMCKSGHRSGLAQNKLEGMDKKIVCIEGGIDALSQDGGFEVRKKQSASCVSLERQVRIVAGSLVLAGVLVGLFVHPLGYGVSAFVGVGLIFAGATGWCGMGLMLAKMPWNK